jgi:glycosyltransferase involved in cell wall biosynthesis
MISSPKKIALLYPRGGLEISATHSVQRLMSVLAVELSQNGFDVLYFSKIPNLESDLTQVLLRHGFVSRILERSKSRLPVGLRRVVEEFLIRIDLAKMSQAFGDEGILLTCSYREALVALDFFPPEKIVYWMHSTAKLAEINQLSTLLQRKINIVTPSRAIYRWVWDRFQSDTVAAIHYLIPNPSQTHGNYEFEFNEFDEELEGVVFLHAGGHSSNKGLHIVTRALRRVSRGVPCTLISVGNNFRVERDGNLVLLQVPRLEPWQLLALISKAEICLMPSLWFENAPLLLIEYRMMGRKVVASRSGGIEEYSDNSKTWFVENPNNVDEWVSQISKALDSDTNPMNHSITNPLISKSEWVQRWRALFEQIENRD